MTSAPRVLIGCATPCVALGASLARGLPQLVPTQRLTGERTQLPGAMRRYLGGRPP